MRLRQVALVARDLSATTEALCDVLGVGGPFRDPGVAVFGLENAVLPVGDTFLEVVSPAREGTSAGRLLERRGGDGGYMVIVQTGDLEASRRRVASSGVRVVWETAFPDMATIHLHPRDVGGAILSLDWADPPDSWRWAGPDWKGRVRTDVTREITAVEIQADDPAAMAAPWADVLGVASRRSGDAWELALDRGCVRFVPLADARGEGLAAVEFALADPERFRTAARARRVLQPDGAAYLCGTHLRPASRPQGG